MPFGILSTMVQLFGSLFRTLIESRIGQIAIAFIVGWVWAYWDTNSTWKAKIAAEQAVIEQQHQAEMRRQKQAAADIVADAAARAEDDQKVVDDLRRQIDEFNSKETTLAPASTPKTLPRAPVAGCAIDGGFADVVRKLDHSATRKSRPARRAR